MRSIQFGHVFGRDTFMSLFQPPEWASTVPLVKNAVLEVFKDKMIVEKIHIGRKAVIVVGRNIDVCDVGLNHSSLSRMHAVFIHDHSKNLQLMDLDSSHGTYWNGKKLHVNVPVILQDGDVITFGLSTREYRVKIDNGNVAAVVTDANGSSSTLAPQLVESASKKMKLSSETIRCRHILVKHKDSRRPSSWKSSTITRTREDARKLASDIRERIIGANLPLPREDEEKVNELDDFFAGIASAESDCSSAKNGGDLGSFGKGKMDPNFEAAAFALKLYEISDLVESASGVHLILRIRDKQ